MSTAKKFETVAEYVASFPPDVQRVLERVRRTVRKAAPGGKERISYQICAYELGGVNVVHVAAYKKHIGVYPAPAGTKAFQREMAPYRAAKATIRLPLDRPIPYALLEQVVLFRVKETQAERQRKKSKPAKR